MTALNKFESQVGEEWVPHRYPKTFVREKTTGAVRLKIAASDHGAQLLLQLASVLDGPFTPLYVLLVPRGGGTEGRFQGPWMDRTELHDFIQRFGPFFEQDGRHHIWLFSDKEKATIVYDQHDVIFAYGPTDSYVRLLESMGYSEGENLAFPAPHGHCYHPAFDEEERALTSSADWRHTPLRQGDEW
jgi:hypothetical protein